MPLFFRRIDACVVDSGNWEAMKELNPQLGRLRVVARSEPYLEGVVAMPLQPHPHQDELVASLLNLHKTPAGEQLGIVFRIGPLVRASKAQFESVRVLRNKYRHIVEASSSGLGPALVRLEDAAERAIPKCAGPATGRALSIFLHALSRWWMLAVLLSLQLSMAQTASSAGADSPDGRGLRRTHLNVVASNRMLNNVNPNDIRAALRLWFETVGRQRASCWIAGWTSSTTSPV